MSLDEMKMKQSSQPLISTGMLPWGIDQWFFISSMMILMMLISNPISSNESMNCLRALTWKSRRPSHLDQINTISLFPVWAIGKTSDFLRSRWVAASPRRPRPSLWSTRCSSRASTSSTQSAPLLPGTPPSWSSSALDSICNWATWTPAWPRRQERKICPGKGGPQTGREVVLPGHPCLPEREGIQWLCLGNCQSGNHEALSVLTSS